jgi:16S rRNA (cytidine1402-2'-O)-methyltransferase
VARTPKILSEAANAPVALVSDAGTPVIADPGARLVAAAHAGGIPVRAMPGPSALTAALSIAGFDVTAVAFLGFLPRTAQARRERLRAVAEAVPLLVFFESPRRLAAALHDVAVALHDPEVVVCRELTKVHEEALRGRASALVERFKETRGECTVVVQVPARPADEHEEVAQYLAEMHRAGARRSAAAAEAARRFGVPRQAAYALWPANEVSP